MTRLDMLKTWLTSPDVAGVFDVKTDEQPAVWVVTDARFVESEDQMFMKMQVKRTDLVTGDSAWGTVATIPEDEAEM